MVLRHRSAGASGRARVVSPAVSEARRINLALQGGVPTESYRTFIMDHFRSSPLPYPETLEQLIKVSLLLSNFAVLVGGVEA